MMLPSTSVLVRLDLAVMGQGQEIVILVCRWSMTRPGGELVIRGAGRVDGDLRGRPVAVLAVPGPDAFAELPGQPGGVQAVPAGPELISSGTGCSGQRPRSHQYTDAPSYFQIRP
jgi:hypothetical protein